MDLKPQIWGPHYWFFLHTVAFNYPIHPIQKKFYELIEYTPSFHTAKVLMIFASSSMIIL